MRFDSTKDLKTGRRVAMLATLALMVAFGGVGCSLDGASKPGAESGKSAGDTPRGSAPPQTSLPMPPTTAAREAALAERGWTFLDGRRAQLADYRGQVVVLDFYATYCPPCKEEIPHLIALQQRYASDGLNVIGLNVGDDADRRKVAGFVKDLGIRYPLGNPDPALVEVFLSDNTAIPQTYVFDRQGRLVKRFIGYDTTMPAELESTIQTALATKAD